jgi:hypothetical protein
VCSSHFIPKAAKRGEPMFATAVASTPRKPPNSFERLAMEAAWPAESGRRIED